MDAIAYGHKDEYYLYDYDPKTKYYFGYTRISDAEGFSDDEISQLRFSFRKKKRHVCNSCYEIILVNP